MFQVKCVERCQPGNQKKMTTLIRSFIAVPLTASIHASLGDFTGRHNLERKNGFRPVKPQNIHLTLKFLGDATPEQLNRVKAGLESCTSSISAFPIELKGVGTYPNWERPRVVWVGIQAAEILQTLNSQIERETLAAGFLSEAKKFSPHLTLARVASIPPSPSTMNVIRVLKGLEPVPSFGTMQVTHVSLFKSVLLPEGPVYTQLSSHFLRG